MTQFIHLRRNDPRIEHKVVDPRGGITIAFDLDTTTGTVVSQAAYCNPKDNYSKRLGRIKAEARLKAHPIEVEDFTDLKDFRKFIYNFWSQHSTSTNRELMYVDWEEGE